MGLVGERVALMARKSLIIGRQIKDIRSVVVDDDDNTFVIWPDCDVVTAVAGVVVRGAPQPQ